MENEYSFVMIKPDALDNTTSKQKARALYYAFSDYLSGNPFNLKGDFLEAALAAEKQAKERSVKEVSFAGKIEDSKEASSLFISEWNCLTEEQIGIPDVIIRGIQNLGFDIVQDIECSLLPVDVDAIYGLSERDKVTDETKSKLHEYLDNQKVRITKLRNYNNNFLLQHWKTFVRHFLIEDRREVYPLRNLIHVSEEDCEYMEAILCMNDEAIKDIDE